MRNKFSIVVVICWKLHLNTVFLDVLLSKIHWFVFLFWLIDWIGTSIDLLRLRFMPLKLYIFSYLILFFMGLLIVVFFLVWIFVWGISRKFKLLFFLYYFLVDGSYWPLWIFIRIFLHYCFSPFIFERKCIGASLKLDWMILKSLHLAIIWQII